MNKKIFNLYKSKLDVHNSNLNMDMETKREVLSIQDIITNYRKLEFDKAVFTHQRCCLTYFQIKMTKFTQGGSEKVML